ncbi:hypothetical protein MLD38_009857 [Melastoma candidum]|uniref:Uncharacterized protein n=1 Tax=Melastoma candidum TaxID=119954 RepID=A0ACB9RYA9_9MYRT|nr:hypothetical protein MLD38_009857 [Melastoma candidum]
MTLAVIFLGSSELAAIICPLLQEIKGKRQVNHIEELFDPSASHKSVHVNKPADLIRLVDPSQVPLNWEKLPVHKTGMAEQRFKEIKMKEKETQRDLDLTLRLKPPEAVQEDKLLQLGPSSSKRPKVNGKTQKYDGPSLVVMECTACYRHVMVSEISPKCPHCKRSSSLLDKFRSC